MPTLTQPWLAARSYTPYGDRLAQLRVEEVVDADLLGVALGLPLPAAVLEVADQFLLLGVHRDDRLAPPLERSDLAVDVLELGVAVGVRAALPWSCGWPGGCSPVGRAACRPSWG